MLEHETRTIQTRLAALDDALEQARREQQIHDRYRTEHNLGVDCIPCVERDINVRVEQLVNANTIDPPGYLHRLGSPPHQPAALDRWRDAARYIERYRAEHDITDPDQPFGPKPAGPPAAAWRLHHDQLDRLISQVHERTLAPGIDVLSRGDQLTLR